MAPYTPYKTAHGPSWQPERYHRKSIVKMMSGFSRYGHTDDINELLSGGSENNDYVKGIVISSCCLLIVFVLWSILLIFLKVYSKTWASGYIERPPAPPRTFQSGSSSRRNPKTKNNDRNKHDRDNDDEFDQQDDTSSTSSTSSRSDSNNSLLSIRSSIFWEDPPGQEEMTMAAIAKEQKRDKTLRKAQRKRPHEYSTTTNGQLTLVTTLDHHSRESAFPQFRVYIPRSLRLTLLRTYHDCLVFPDDVSNAHTMIYEFFTWKDIRKDVSRYVKKYRQSMERGDNAALVRYGSEDGEEDSTPITLDVIAREQREDPDLTRMARKAPSVFSTATNGSIQLITARGKDKKYRIVIPTNLQPKVLKTYHDCLVNPTPKNNFEKVLYVHFTWNGIHKDVDDYVANEGLTNEMRSRRGHTTADDERTAEKGRNGAKNLNVRDVFLSNNNDNDEEEEEEDDAEPIGLDEIAKEQKKDKELRQLKKEEPFVFSTVRYGNTLLTTAQNFRDNKYRIVIPKRLQGRMLKTYRECLLNPTPDRNFDTLLYNHFTWNGIHDDVDYFVKNGGHISDRDEDFDFDERRPLNPSSSKSKSKNGRAQNSEDDADWVKQNKKIESKVKMIRIAFLLSGFFVIISSILFFEEGVVRMFDSLSDAQRSIDQAESVANSALFLINDYMEIQPDIQDMAKEIGTYNNSQLCYPVLQQNSSLSNSNNNNTLALAVPNSTYDIGLQLRDSAIRVELVMMEMEGDLEKIVQRGQDLHATLEDFKTYVDVARVLVIFIDIIVVSLMTTCILAWMGEQCNIPRYVRKTVIIPLFVALVIIFWVFSAGVLLGAMAGADFCLMPDASSTVLIGAYQEQMSPLVFVLTMYYVTGCLPERLPPKLENLSSIVSSSGNFVHSLLNVASKVFQQTGLSDQCEGGDGIEAMLKLSDTAYHGIYDILLGVRGMLECRNFNPIYTTLVYDAVCNSGVAGMSWIFFTSLSMAIFSMFMVTLRAAIHEY